LGTGYLDHAIHVLLSRHPSCVGSVQQNAVTYDSARWRSILKAVGADVDSALFSTDAISREDLSERAHRTDATAVDRIRGSVRGDEAS